MEEVVVVVVLRSGLGPTVRLFFPFFYIMCVVTSTRQSISSPLKTDQAGYSHSGGGLMAVGGGFQRMGGATEVLSALAVCTWGCVRASQSSRELCLQKYCCVWTTKKEKGCLKKEAGLKKKIIAYEEVGCIRHPLWRNTSKLIGQTFSLSYSKKSHKALILTY